MTRFHRWITVVVTGLTLVGCAQASRKDIAALSTMCAILRPVPPPLVLYRGTDVDAHAEQSPVSLAMEAMVRLDAHIAANPDDVDALLRRGYEYAQRNDRSHSEADFARARTLAPERTRVYWSQGWARYSMGDPACAIEAWQHAAGMLAGDDVWIAGRRKTYRLNAGGDAFWIPYTLAIGYWSAGEYEIALDYYSAAVRSFPQRFATMGALDAYTHNWKPRERMAILAVASAWKADSKRSDPDVHVHHGYGIAPASTPRQ